MRATLLLACAVAGETDLTRAWRNDKYNYASWPCLGHCPGHARAIKMAGGAASTTAALARYVVARRPAVADADAARAALKLVGWPDRNADNIAARSRRTRL